MLVMGRVLFALIVSVPRTDDYGSAMYSVPVKCETHGGFGEMQGILRFDGQRLVLQYQTSDSMFGVLRSQPKEIDIPLDGVVDARCSPGWFWLLPRIQLRLSDFTAVAQLPAIEAGRLDLRVRWSDRHDARRLVEYVSAFCTELRYARMNAEISRMTHTDPLAQARISGRISTPPPAPRSESQS